MKRLAGQHAVCIDEVDQLLRAGIFVDLYRVVKQGARVSVESYSKRGISSTVPHPTALIPQNIVGADAQDESLLRLVLLCY
jgi:uncharacterized protein